MKKIVPFKKDLIFKTNIAEITSISLEHTLSLKDNNLVSGAFIITGDYKMTDTSINTEKFDFNLPFDINIDDKYVTDNVVLDIDDFYYEIVDNKKLSVNIDVLIDGLEEKPLIIKEEKEEVRCIEDEFPFKEFDENIPLEIKKDNKKEETKFEEVKDITEKEEIKVKDEKEKISVSSLFDSFSDDSDTSESYYIYFYRENDSIEGVLQKYNITKENLSLYNNINDLKIGDKLIIPSIKNEKV